MANFPFETTRVAFRRWTEADLPLALSLWGDPKVMRFIGSPLSPAQAAARLQTEIGNMATYGMAYWPIFLRNDGVFAGCCGLRPYEIGIPELGFHLMPASWGQGLALEAANAAIEYAFEGLGARAIFAGHHPENLASRKVLERLGFVYTHLEPYGPTGLLHPAYLLNRAN